jgi:hypothetical protein
LLTRQLLRGKLAEAMTASARNPLLLLISLPVFGYTVAGGLLVGRAVKEGQ